MSLETESNAAPPAAPADRASLLLTEILEVQRRGRARGRVVALAALALVAVVLGVVADTARTNFSAENVKASAEAELRVLLPQVREEATVLLEQVRPVFLAEVRRVFDASMPEMRRRVETELGGVGELAFRHSQESLTRAVHDAADAGADAIAAEFPEIDDVVLTAFVDDLSAELTRRTEGFVGEVHDAGRPAIDRFAEGLSRFPRRPELTDDQLYRQFMHLWLMLLDAEILEGVPVDSATTADLAAHSPTRG